jgi:hypothetical protein
MTLEEAIVEMKENNKPARVTDIDGIEWLCTWSADQQRVLAVNLADTTQKGPVPMSALTRDFTVQ